MDFDFKAFFKRLYRKAMYEEDILSTAAQVGFYFTFALFPLLLFLFSLLGFVLESADEFRREFFIYMRQIMPYSAYDLVQNTIKEVTENSSGGKLTIGILIALWSASAGVDSLRIALNSVYNLEEKRSWIKTKLIALGSTLSLTVLVILALGIVFYGWKFLSFILDAIHLPIPSPIFLMVLQWITILVVLLAIFGLIYNFLPSYKEHKWVWITPGAVTGIVLWLSASYLFRLYLSYFNSYAKTYGSLGAVIILMLWLYLTALVILIGGIINGVLQEMTDPETAKESKEKSAIKLEQAKASMPAHEAEKMIKERKKELSKFEENSSDETDNNSDSEETDSGDAQQEIDLSLLQPTNVSETKDVNSRTEPDSKENDEQSGQTVPQKTIVGLTVAGVFGFLMGLIFKKKE